MQLLRRRITARLVMVGLMGALAGCSTYGNYPGYFGNGHGYGTHGVRSGYHDPGRARLHPRPSARGQGLGNHATGVHHSSGSHNRGGHGDISIESGATGTVDKANPVRIKW